MIHFLEDKIKPRSFEGIFYESIICHHNEINNASYIFDNYLTQEGINNYNQLEFFYKYVYFSYDYFFYPEDILSLIQIEINIESITIPSSVTSIRNHSFSGCSSLAQISIPSSVTSIDFCAFRKCSSLTQILIPSSVISIGDDAFGECSSLTKISIPSLINTQNLGIKSRVIINMIMLIFK